MRKQDDLTAGALRAQRAAEEAVALCAFSAASAPLR
jgi:hypothetical protein